MKKLLLALLLCITFGILLADSGEIVHIECSINRETESCNLKVVTTEGNYEVNGYNYIRDWTDEEREDLEGMKFVDGHYNIMEVYYECDRPGTGCFTQVDILFDSHEWLRDQAGL